MAREDMTQLWIERIKDYRASGESVAAWCERHQVTQHQLWYWMRKLRKAEQQTLSAEQPQWVSLRLDEAASEGTAPIVVRVAAVAVEVKSGFDPSLLADVVRTLKALC